MSFLEKFKNKKMIIGVGAFIIIALGVGIFIYNKYKLNNEQMTEMQSLIETYTIADNEKIFINGSIVPTKSKNFNPTEEISKLNVTNGKVVKEGDLLYTVKNQALLDEIDGLKSQVSELKKSNTASDPLINTEISKLNAQISDLDKKAYVNTFSPFYGKVYLNEQSESMGETSSFMTVISDEFYMKGQASEQDLSKLQIDDPVDVLVFSNNKNLAGRISFISDRPSSVANDMNMSEQGNLSYYDINISFDDQEGLVNGFHVQATIEVRDSLAKIPTSSIIRIEDKAYVFKDLDGIIKKQAVEISSENKEFTVVKAGLDKNDVIIRYPSEDMQEGDPINTGNNSSTEENIEILPEASKEGVEN